MDGFGWRAVCPLWSEVAWIAVIWRKAGWGRFQPARLLKAPEQLPTAGRVIESRAGWPLLLGDESS
jgi:hypothetical protein